MSAPNPRTFFIGFVNAVPAGLRVFLPVVMVALVALFAGLGYVVARGQEDPGDGTFRFDLGPQEVTGLVQLLPYPTLTITEGNDNLAAGHVLMMSGQGKRGADLGSAQDGDLVAVRGIKLQRGELDMLQLGRSEPAEGTPPALAEDTSLGRWRLTGELCDGKCLAGAMRPGTGLAHKACADLCLIGGVPPIFVTTAPVVEDLPGSEFLMVGAPDGGPMADVLLDQVGSFIALEGEIRRRGDLLIFLADPDTAEVL